MVSSGVLVIVEGIKGRWKLLLFLQVMEEVVTINLNVYAMYWWVDVTACFTFIKPNMQYQRHLKEVLL